MDLYVKVSYLEWLIKKYNNQLIPLNDELIPANNVSDMLNWITRDAQENSKIIIKD